MSSLLNKLCGYCEVEVDQPLSKMTTLRIGGNAKYVAYPDTLASFEGLMRVLRDEGVAWKIFGKGSDILCSDDEYDGVIVRLDKHFHHRYFNGTMLIAEAGAPLVGLASEAMKLSLSGLEFASGIPGTVGGSVFMNAGAYRSCMADIVSEVLVYRDGDYCWMNNKDCQFGYRSSIFQSHPSWVVLAAIINLKECPREEISKLMEERRQRRINTQPLDKFSCGSVFRNPENDNAWRLIQEIGYRGKKKGDACVSEKHCNFIVNEGNATAKDYIELVQEIIVIVQQRFGITLETEMEMFNWQEK